VNGATAVERRGLRLGALVGALLVVALGLALWPHGRGEPPMQMWSDDASPAGGHPTVVRPPADVRTQGTASAGCPAGGGAAPAGRRGT
jgi:hypothetical protein